MLVCKRGGHFMAVSHHTSFYFALWEIYHQPSNQGLAGVTSIMHIFLTAILSLCYAFGTLQLLSKRSLLQSSWPPNYASDDMHQCWLWDPVRCSLSSIIRESHTLAWQDLPAAGQSLIDSGTWLGSCKRKLGCERFSPHPQHGSRYFDHQGERPDVLFRPWATCGQQWLPTGPWGLAASKDPGRLLPGMWALFWEEQNKQLGSPHWRLNVLCLTSSLTYMVLSFHSFTIAMSLTSILTHQQLPATRKTRHGYLRDFYTEGLKGDSHPTF